MTKQPTNSPIDDDDNEPTMKRQVCELKVDIEGKELSCQRPPFLFFAD